MDQAIDIKKTALQNSIQAGAWDMEAALSLAEMINQDQQLKMSIEQGDYQSFQDIVAKLLDLDWLKTQQAGG